MENIVKRDIAKENVVGINTIKDGIVKGIIADSNLAKGIVVKDNVVINNGVFSVLDIDAIDITVLLNGVYTKASVSSVIDAYEKMRVWHKQALKTNEDIKRVTYAISLGFKKDDPYVTKGLNPVSGIEWKDVIIQDDYIVSRKEIDFSDWIEWVTNCIRSKYTLKPFRSTSTYLEVHVSWDVWNGYFHVNRRRKNMLVDHAHNIMDTSWNTRALIIAHLLGSDWTFVYKNAKGESHYYYGNTTQIYHEIVRLATNAYQILNIQSSLSQSEALEALLLFYKKYPQFKNNLLENYYLLENIVQLSAPNYDEAIRNAALPILYLIPPEDSLMVMEKIYNSLQFQIQNWKKIIDNNKEILEKTKESSDLKAVKE